MRTLSPSGLTTKPPRRKGLSRGNSTLILMKRAYSNVKAFLLISTTCPRLASMSQPVSSNIKSNGNPHTCTHIGIEVNLTNLAIIPLSHLLKTSGWISKLHGPLVSTYFNWLSIVNLNRNSPSPTSTILRSVPIFHTDLSNDFAALQYGRVVRNPPNRLREHSSKILSLCVAPTCITSSSSLVKVISCNLSIKSNSISLIEKKTGTKKRPSDFTISRLK